MNCLTFRRNILTDPYRVDRDMDEHAETCPTCRNYAKEISRIDANIREALTVEVPEGLAAKILLNQSLQPQPRRPTRRYWFGMAASFLVLALGFAVYSTTRSPEFDEHLLVHIEHEYERTNERDFSSEQLQQVLYSVNAEATTLPGQVVYAANCVIDGKLVAHLVIRDENQEIALILVPHEQVSSLTGIANATWQGLITPHPVGNLVVVANTAGQSADTSLLETSRTYSNAIHPRSI